jgi:hypothetical protein
MKAVMNKERVQDAISKRHYWIRDDFDHLMGLLPGGDHEFPGDRKSSSSLVYPKNTEGAFRELRLRGLNCDGITLWNLVAAGTVRPEGAREGMTWTGEDYLEWSKEDIDAAAEHLYENQSWNSWTHYCWVNNLSFGQCVKAFRVACARFNLPFSLGFDPVGLVSVVEPADDTADFGYIRFFSKGVKLEAMEESE